MATKTPLNRVAFSPGEFATLFGKSQTWGYRQIYSGKVKTITAHGRILIPAAEVEAILKTAGVYDGVNRKTATPKPEIQRLAPKLKNAWRDFLVARRQAAIPAKTPAKLTGLKVKWPNAKSARKAAMERLTGHRQNSRSKK